MCHRSRFAAPLALALLTVGLAPRAAAQGPPTAPEIQQAGALMNQGEFDKAVALLEELLGRDPSENWAWFQLGLAHHFAGRLDQALRGHMLSLVGASPTGRLRSTASYNIACVHALQGRTELALQWLHRARLAGWQDAAGARADGDLTSLREDPRFAALLDSPAVGQFGQALASSLTEPLAGGTGGVACGPDGTVYVADFQSRLWRFSPSGERSLFAKGFTKAAGTLVEPDGHVLQVDFEGAAVWRIDPAGDKQQLPLEGLVGPVGVARSADGTLFLTDFRRRAVLRVKPGGQPEELAVGGLLKGPNGITLAPNGDLYVVNYDDGALLRVQPDGTLSFVAEVPGGGNGHVTWVAGNLFVTARRGNAVYRVSPTGQVDLVVGDGSRGVLDGVGSEARLALPNGIAASSDGKTLFVNDQPTSAMFVLRSIALK